MTQQKIEPHYVDFATAKWLKEKGFDVPCKQRFWVGFEGDFHFQDDCLLLNYNNYDDSSITYYSAPEQHQVIEWLRVNHGIWIAITINGLDKLFTFDIHNYKQQGSLGNIQNGGYNSPQEAYSAAFDYIRKNNLI